MLIAVFMIAIVLIAVAFYFGYQLGCRDTEKQIFEQIDKHL